MNYSTDYLLVDRYFADNLEELLESIKMDYPNISIILLTGVEPEIDQLELEFDDYIVKPADKSRIIDKIESADIKEMERGLMED